MLNLGLGVFVTALVARLLGHDGYGQWSTVFVVLSLTGYLVSFGVERIVIREAARYPAQEQEWLGAMVMLRLLATVPTMLISAIAILLLHASQQMLAAGLILIVAMPIGTIGTLGIVFQLRVKNLVPMLEMSLRSVVWAVAVFVIYSTGGGMVALAIAMVLTNSLGSVVEAVAARTQLDRWPWPSRKRLRELLGASIPFGISGLLVIAYARIDEVIVFAMTGSRAAGLYGSVYNILEQAHFVPISILTTLAPVIAASWPSDPARMMRATRMGAELMAVGSFGALAFVAVAAEPVVRLIFGPEYVAAAPALPVLGGAFVVICFDYLVSNLIVVLRLQRRLVYISLAALIANVGGNLILVPVLGFMGAAWMTLVTELVVFAGSVWLLSRALDEPLPLPGRVVRAAVSAALLWAVLALIDHAGASLALLVIAACVVYPLALFALRALGADDVRVLLRRRDVTV